MASAVYSGRKIVAGILITIVVSFGIFATIKRFVTITDSTLLLNASLERKFMLAWQSDLDHLRRGGYLPKSFEDVRTVQLNATTMRLKHTFAQYPIDFHVKKDGHYTLEVFVDEIEDNGGIVVQYDLIDNKSGNLVFELGRTFPQKLTAITAEPSPAQRR
jgi:hypothetical protein